MKNRVAVVAACLAGAAAVVAFCAMASGPADAVPSLAEKRAMLRQFATPANKVTPKHKLWSNTCPAAFPHQPFPSFATPRRGMQHLAAGPADRGARVTPKSAPAVLAATLTNACAPKRATCLAARPDTRIVRRPCPSSAIHRRALQQPAPGPAARGAHTRSTSASDVEVTPTACASDRARCPWTLASL